MRTASRFKTTIIKKPIVNTLLNSDIITTPCEKVLSILRQTKNYISNISKKQVILIQNLDWCIKIITSRSLYSYELKEKEAVEKLAEQNSEFKQLVDFVSEYNEKVIQMNRKYNSILSDKLLEKSSTKLNKRKIERKNSFGEEESNYSKLLNFEKSDREEKNSDKINDKNKKNKINLRKTMQNSFFNTNLTIDSIDGLRNHKYIKITKNNPFEGIIRKKINLKKSNKKPFITINDEKNQERIYNINNSVDNAISKLNKTADILLPKTKQVNNIKKYNKNNKFLVSFDQNYLNKKSKTLFPSVQKISITINNHNNNLKEIENYIQRKKIGKPLNSINAVNISLTNSIVCSNNNSFNNVNINKNKLSKYKTKSKTKIPNIKENSYSKMQNQLMHEGYDISKLITQKIFNIFELKELIGYNNVLLIMGRTILENLGLLDEEILNISKIDPFLNSVSNQYKESSLYHNALHGSDVTHSVYIFFTHSNAEKIAKTNVLDLLSIIIAALGHDLGHPGLNNAFLINDSADMALTYNDVSVLENFHASTLFKTLRKSENNIFEKLTTIDYKIIRKRMISEILSTDMANHGKVISLIKSKISLNENNEYKLNLLSGNEQTKNEEQQCLLDFMLHLADLAHNTKLFNISIQWVELLSEEFWRQGDLEKELKLPVSFLCDREDVNIPKSQTGFISGFVIPNFECLVTIFPTLKFTLDNANENLKQWKKLLDEGRKTGWTPPKTKKIISNPLSSKTITNKNPLYNNYFKIKSNKNERNNKKNINIALKIKEYSNKKNKKSRNENNYSNEYYSFNNKKYLTTFENDRDKKNLNKTIINRDPIKKINNNITKEILKKSILKNNRQKLNISKKNNETHKNILNKKNLKHITFKNELNKEIIEKK